MQRFDIINHLIETFNYKTYLEIGTKFGECYNFVNAKHKESVDPVKCINDLTHNMTSDEYFNQNTKTFDIIFIDGLHVEEQTTKDINNSLQILNNNGSVIVHDCLPSSEEFTEPHWSGTVFRSLINLRYNNPFLSVHVINADCGCGIIRKTSSSQTLYNKAPIELAKTYPYNEKNKHELMNVISVEEFQAIFKK